MKKKTKGRILSRSKVLKKKLPPQARPRSKASAVEPSPIFETLVETPVAETLRAEPRLLTDLPFSYGETKLLLLVRDPYWAFGYWDFSPETWHWVQQKLREEISLKPRMRIHDLDAKRTWDLLVSLEAKNWYLHLGTPNHRYVAELGIGDGNARFYLLARSNEVRTPRDSPSDVIDKEWSPEDFEEIYRLSGGGKPGQSSPGSLFFPRQA